MRLAVAEGDDWVTLGRLWQLFSHDLSAFRGNLPSRAGLFFNGRERWREYVADPDRCGYLVLDDDQAAVGFALVRGHPGTWEVAFQEENAVAAAFWRSVWTGLFDDVLEELRPAPGRPELRPDTWLTGR